MDKDWLLAETRPEWRMEANLKRGNPRNIHIAAAFEFDDNSEARAGREERPRTFCRSQTPEGVVPSALGGDRGMDGSIRSETASHPDRRIGLSW